ncbi:MAG: hypothetical protein DWQ30_12660 [Acidobacteria bacterium]|nr:MAG: hypothetical protein DWQ30_12660 [Acidobacteriota bacterium]
MYERPDGPHCRYSSPRIVFAAGLCVVVSLALAPAAPARIGGASSAALTEEDDPRSAFEGTWRIDLERSDPMTQQGLEVDNAYRLTLDGENLQAVRTFYSGGREAAVDWTFVTDGKAHEIPGLRRPRQARAKWKKDRLTVSYTLTLETQRGDFDIDVVEPWKVTPDGELEIRYDSRMPSRSQTRREIYVRQP